MRIHICDGIPVSIERNERQAPSACDGGLRRLRLDQIALYQLHRPDPRVALEESIGALVELKDQGKLRHIGLSNVSERQPRQAQRLTPIVSLQNRYNLVDRGSDALVDLCEQERITFLPWAPIQDLERNRMVRPIAERHAATPTQVVLAWLLARSPAIVPIPGTGLDREPRGDHCRYTPPPGRRRDRRHHPTAIASGLQRSSSSQTACTGTRGRSRT